MNKFTLASLLVLASTAAAQNCFEPNLGTNIGAGDDTVLSGGPIGFAFPFNGQTYTDIYVSTNGFLYLASPTTAIPTASNCCQGSTAILAGSANPMIAPFWDDLNVIAANGAGVYVNSSANACVVTWDKVVQYSNTVQFQMQVQLLPSGEIKFTYGGNTQVRLAGDVLVGVSEGNGALVPGASDFSIPGASTSFTTFEMFNAIGSFDMAGDSLSLIPTGPTWFYLATDCRGSATTYGNGCIRQVDSFYESFGSAAAFDLANSSAMMLNTGNGYLVLPSTTGFVAPTAAAQALALGDDSETTVSLSAAMPVAGGSTSNLTVCSNGYVSVASGNGTGYTPNVATFLTGTQTSWRCWHDYNPSAAGSGQVKFEEIAGIAYVTWDGVFDYGTTGPGSTFQFQFELATGNVTFVTGNFSLLGNAHLVGYSVGGASNDPGNTDLSVALPATLQVFNTQVVPLALSASGVPSFGANLTLDTANIPAGSPFGATLIGLAEFNPGLDLTGLGMPGCQQYTDGSATFLFFVSGSTASTPFAAPANPAFFGVNLTAQSSVFAPGTTPLGFITSNGVRLTLGY